MAESPFTDKQDDASTQTIPVTSAQDGNDSSGLVSILHQRNREKRRAREKLLYRLKRLCWRTTSAWYWLKAIFNLLGQSQHLEQLSNFIALTVQHAAITYGFSPARPSEAGYILKWLWLLTLSEFNLAELICLLTLYIPLAPIAILLVRLNRQKLKTTLEQVARARIDRGSAFGRRVNIPITAASFTFLSAWLVLYSNSSNKVVGIIGSFFCGLLFLARIAAAFRYARMTDDLKNNLLDGFIANATKNLKEESASLNNHAYKKRIDVSSALSFSKFNLFVLRKIAIATRGARGRQRFALFTLLQYSLNLVILSAISILFWALVIRVATGFRFNLSQSVFLSAGHIIPGMPPTDAKLDVGYRVGASLTGWLLFVIYAGPAASVFPTIQQTYVNAATRYHSLLRPLITKLPSHIHKLREVKNTLP